MGLLEEYWPLWRGFLGGPRTVDGGVVTVAVNIISTIICEIHIQEWSTHQMHFLSLEHWDRDFPNSLGRFVESVACSLPRMFLSEEIAQVQLHPYTSGSGSHIGVAVAKRMVLQPAVGQQTLAVDTMSAQIAGSVARHFGIAHRLSIEPDIECYKL